MCLDREHPAIDFDGRPRMSHQVMVPGSILLVAPIGANQEIKSFGLKISNRCYKMPAGFSSDGVQQEDGLRTKPAAEATAADPDGNSVNCHKDLQRKSLHPCLNRSPERLARFTREAGTKAEGRRDDSPCRQPSGAPTRTANCPIINCNLATSEAAVKLFLQVLFHRFPVILDPALGDASSVPSGRSVWVKSRHRTLRNSSEIKDHT